MKTNAIIRIIIWSLVLVLLVGLLGAGLLFRNHRLTSNPPAETAIPVPLTEPLMEPLIISEEEFPVTCDTEATVTANGLNVRSVPSSIGTIVGMVEKGDIVSINRGVEINGQQWLGINSPVTGWIIAQYVDSIEDVVFYSSEELRSGTYSNGSNGVTASVTEEVNIRTAPSEDTKAVGILHPGDTVTIGRQENVVGEAWAYITAPEAGWVQAKYLKATESGTSVQSPVGDISLDAKQIREIDIEWAAGNITIQPGDVDSIQISESDPSDPKYAMVWRQNNDKLTIRFSENMNLDFNFGITINDVIAKNLTILVPMGWECDSLEIAAASAALNVKNMVIREVDFDGASGICNFENCAIDELDVDTASGDIYFTGSLDVLDCDAASASVVAVFDNAPSRISMDSMSGDLDITLHEGVGFTVSMDGLSTDFISDFGYSQNRDGSFYRGNGECRINMDGMSGDLYIREYKAAAAAPETIAPTEEPTSATQP